MKRIVKMAGIVASLAAGTILAGSLYGCAHDEPSNSSEPPPAPEDRPAAEAATRTWPEHPAGMDYERLVVVNTSKDNGQIKVRCALPEIGAGKIMYRVKSVSVKDAQSKEIPATLENSKLTFVAPEEQLPGITLDATYIDARSFEETTTDPDQRIDWNIRSLRFDLSDILANGYRNSKPTP